MSLQIVLIARSRNKGIVLTMFGRFLSSYVVITLVVTVLINVTVFRTAVKAVSGHEGKAAVFHKTYK